MVGSRGGGGPGVGRGWWRSRGGEVGLVGVQGVGPGMGG